MSSFIAMYDALISAGSDRDRAKAAVEALETLERRLTRLDVMAATILAMQIGTILLIVNLLVR